MPDKQGDALVSTGLLKLG